MTEEASNEWVWDVSPNNPKSEWGEGPWQDEPDKIVWVDPASDLDCMIIRGPSGALCGYVGVPTEHPAYGLDGGELEIYAHGGVNFAGECHGIICHVPEPGRTDHVWWLGFDCAHFNDYCPAFAVMGEAFNRLPNEQYKTVKYVKRECENLAHQLKEMEEADVG